MNGFQNSSYALTIASHTIDAKVARAGAGAAAKQLRAERRAARRSAATTARPTRSFGFWLRPVRISLRAAH